MIQRDQLDLGPFGELPAAVSVAAVGLGLQNLVGEADELLGFAGHPCDLRDQLGFWDVALVAFCKKYAIKGV